MPITYVVVDLERVGVTLGQRRTSCRCRPRAGNQLAAAGGDRAALHGVPASRSSFSRTAGPPRVAVDLVDRRAGHMAIHASATWRGTDSATRMWSAASSHFGRLDRKTLESLSRMSGRSAAGTRGRPARRAPGVAVANFHEPPLGQATA